MRGLFLVAALAMTAHWHAAAALDFTSAQSQNASDVGAKSNATTTSSNAAATTNIATTPTTVKPNATDFHYRTYSEMVDAMENLASKHPQFVKLETVQKTYGLPERQELQCVHQGKKEPCKNYVLTITNQKSLKPDLPEVFFSGALHGNERVGPQSAITLAEMLVDHASRKNGNPWLKRLVRTRSIVIMPMTNPYGYEIKNRTENSIDPNRDFPYSKSGADCFKTMTARALNELWRDHLFQLAITWHGGTQSISYEWGAFNHAKTKDGKGSLKSPDDNAQFLIARGLSRFGGQFEDDKSYYPDGPINDVVYAVDGGMEDWGYAASWENNFTKPAPIGICAPTTYDGYSPEKSKYNNVSNRAFNILIETSKNKEPTETELGSKDALSDKALDDYLPKDTTIGHVPRNVRIALMLIDLVQPYVEWVKKPTKVTKKTSQTFEWSVGGGITVDSTTLRCSKTSNMASPKESSEQKGVTRWYHADMNSSTGNVNKGHFHTDITFDEAGTYYVQAIAVVDKNWATQGTGNNTAVPNIPPQSHVVNARTNPEWYAVNGAHSVKGQVEWKSSVVKVVVG